MVEGTSANIRAEDVNGMWTGGLDPHSIHEPAEEELHRQHHQNQNQQHVLLHVELLALGVTLYVA